MQNNCMHDMQYNKPGISFIEILVILLLISISMSMLIPRFITNRPQIVQKKFFSEFSLLISDTAYQAIMSQKIHQIFFDFSQKKIIVKQYQNISDDSNKHNHFKPLPKDIFHTHVDIPEQFVIKNFIIQGKDEIQSNKIMQNVWFYIMPDGSCQPTTINIVDETQNTANKFSITINPFYCQATFHETFQA